MAAGVYDCAQMRASMEQITCPNCSGKMEQTEKTTFSGRDMREYRCANCGRTEIIDHGLATWQAMSDANEHKM